MRGWRRWTGCLALLVTSTAFLSPLGIPRHTELVTIENLLANPDHYDGRRVTVRGNVTRPELHVTDNRLFIDYVFVLRADNDSIVVYGRHDRTLGDIQIATDRRVQVRGVFHAEQHAQGQRLDNVLHAREVTVYPPPNPRAA